MNYPPDILHCDIFTIRAIGFNVAILVRLAEPIATLYRATLCGGGGADVAITRFTVKQTGHGFGDATARGGRN